MYVPSSFKVDDAAKLSAFMNAHSFATLVTTSDGSPFATQLPVRHIVENGACSTLIAHMARANPQWQHFSAEGEVLTIFTGPHAYVSPTWYATPIAVPTWNYATVHVYGVPRIIEDHASVVKLLGETIAWYERSFERPWSGETIADELRDQLIDAIVAFEIQVTRVEGKFKLGQNRSAEDCLGVYRALNSSAIDDDRDLAELMRSEGLVQPRPDLD